MLESGEFADKLSAFIETQQKTVQNNTENAINRYARTMEQLIDERIKSMDLKLIFPAGSIQVSGNATNQSNLAPITINFSGSNINIT